MKRRKKNFFLELFVIGLFIMGVLLIGLPFLKEQVIEIQLQTSQTYLESALPEIPAEEPIRPPQLKDVYQNGFGQEFPSYGIIRIPRIEWHQPLLVGITNANLLRGGVVMYPERKLAEGNVVIAGHHLGISELLFGPLLSVQEGDIVEVDFLQQQAKYQIDRIKVVNETELDVLANTDVPELTLLTCSVPERTNERLVLKGKPMIDSLTSVQNEATSTRTHDAMPEANRLSTQEFEKSLVLEKRPTAWLWLLGILFVLILGVMVIHSVMSKITGD